MKMRIITLSILILGFVANSYSEMSKDKFLDQFKQPFVTTACQQKGVISRCFKIDTKGCINNINQVYSLCRKRIHKRMPSMVKTVYDSRIWGSTIAMCVVQQIKTSNEALFMNNVDRCSGIKKLQAQKPL